VLGSVHLDEVDDISDHWPATMPPNPKHLHIIVEIPSGERCAHWVSEISLTMSRLSSTSFLTSLLLLAAVLTMSSSFIATYYHAFLVGSVGECFIRLFALAQDI
jgi:hypothetical protein